MTTPLTTEQRLDSIAAQLTWLTAQVSHLYNRLQMPFVPVHQQTDGRTETGQGVIVSPDKSNYV